MTKPSSRSFSPCKDPLWNEAVKKRELAKTQAEYDVFKKYKARTAITK
jgi:hypothetical protein